VPSHDRDDGNLVDPLETAARLAPSRISTVYNHYTTPSGKRTLRIQSTVESNRPSRQLDRAH